MTRVSISEAARLAGVSRQHLYAAYIEPGRLSIERDGDKPPKVDTSELLRVFGNLKGEEAPEIPASNAEADGLRRLLAERDAQLVEAREREAWLRNHISEVTGALRLLEDKSDSQARITRLMKSNKALAADAERVIGRLKAERDALLERGFWARLFNKREV